MRFALINPAWNFEGSIYFGCHEPHLPLEYGYAKALLERDGHDVLIIDAQLYGLSERQIVESVEQFRPDFIVVTTAPSYLFWRCPPPELRIPLGLVNALRHLESRLVVVGPHGSTTPRAVIRKLSVDYVVIGECEEILPLLANDKSGWKSLAFWENEEVAVRGPTHSCDMKALPPISWPAETVALHGHHHHRFDAPPSGPGAEVEASRGCPYHCTFCAKDNFRDSYRKRLPQTVLAEIDALLSQGVEYIYFIDEIFLPDSKLLSSLAKRRVKIGIQTRIDLWSEESLSALAKAGCVSVEAGVESITEQGRAYLDKKCKLSTEQLTSRLYFAKERIPFVQANLLAMEQDDAESVERWRKDLEGHGIWANKPVPLFPYPGSPEYRRRWGTPDDSAWERAHNAYLHGFEQFSDIQDQQPQKLVELETVRHA